MTLTIDDSLVAKLRGEVALELSQQVRALAGTDGASSQRGEEELLARRILNQRLDRLATDAVATGDRVFSDAEEQELTRAVLDRLFQMGRLQPLLDDDSIQNITANGCDRVFIEYADGRKEVGPAIAATDDELIEQIREIGRRWGLSEREFNPGRPQLNLQLPDGSRLFAVAWVCDRPALAIRRHRFLKVTLDDMVGLGALDRGIASFLRAAVRARRQIIVCGATGAGKTTMLRALASEIPPSERIVTIESEMELGLERFEDLHPDCVALEAREANVEGVGEVTAADLVRMSLRMNPDRVIVGEVRGDEVIPMLNAMSQGNDGSMCTIHADSSMGVFTRLQMYMAMTPERFAVDVTNLMIANAVHVIVHLARLDTNERVVTSIREITGADGPVVSSNEVYAPDHTGRAMPRFPLTDTSLQRLERAGFDARWLRADHAGWAR